MNKKLVAVKNRIVIIVKSDTTINVALIVVPTAIAAVICSKIPVKFETEDEDV